MPAKDYFEDGADSPDKPSDQSPEPEKDGSESKTALIPNDFCKDMEVGQTITVRVVRIGEDQAEVEYEPEGDKGPDKEPEPDKAPMPSGLDQSGGMYE